MKKYAFTFSDKEIQIKNDTAKKTGWKKAILYCLLGGALVAPVFAVSAESSGITALDNFSDTLLTVFTSSWVEVVCIIALVVIGIIGIASFNSGGGVQVLKSLAPWAIGVILIMSASSITDFFWDKGTESGFLATETVIKNA